MMNFRIQSALYIMRPLRVDADNSPRERCKRPESIAKDSVEDKEGTKKKKHFYSWRWNSESDFFLILIFLLALLSQISSSQIFPLFCLHSLSTLKLHFHERTLPIEDGNFFSRVAFNTCFAFFMKSLHTHVFFCICREEL